MRRNSPFFSIHREQSIPFSPNVSTNLLSLDVTPQTRGSNLVKLDTTAQIQFTTTNLAEEIDYILWLRLETSSDILATLKLERHFISSVTNNSNRYTDSLNLTWDHRLTCDQTYSISAQFNPISFTPSSLEAQTRSLNAIVFQDESCDFFC